MELKIKEIMNKITNYNKFIVALLGALTTFAADKIADTSWATLVTSVLTAALVFFVPNTEKY